MSVGGIGAADCQIAGYGTSRLQKNIDGNSFIDQMVSTYKTQRTATGETSDMTQLQNVEESTAVSKMEAYQKYLEQKYGNVSIQNVGKDQKSMDNIGAGTVGTGNVIIASNILEQMANNSEKASYYEEKIQHYFDSLPIYAAQLSAMGHEIHSSGIIIHPDGTVTHYICGDLKPEVRAKIEARMKAEAEAKAKRKRQYQEQSEEAAKRRKLEMEIAYKKQNMAELLASYKIEEAGSVSDTLYFCS